jgi:hypothetical protein
MPAPQQMLDAAQSRGFVRNNNRLDRKALSRAIAEHLTDGHTTVATSLSKREILLDVLGIGDPDEDALGLISQLLVPIGGWVQRQLDGSGLMLLSASRSTVLKGPGNTQRRIRERGYFISADPDLVTEYELKVAVDRIMDVAARCVERHTFTTSRIPDLIPVAAQLRLQGMQEVQKRLLPPKPDKGGQAA